MDPMVYAFALGTLFGMFALLLVGMVANVATRRAAERARHEQAITERVDRNALEVDRLLIERQAAGNGKRTMWDPR